MKTKKTYPDRKNRKRTLKYGVAALSIFILSVLAARAPLYPSSSSSHPNPNVFGFRAAIVDQLSLTAPNQTFVRTATTILQKAGFTVDYYPGENVTVEFYRNLPTHGYRIIILRVHSALPANMSRPLAFFTSETYSKTRYVHEQLADQLAKVTYHAEDPNAPSYFGIWSETVKNCMNGRFQNATIFAMGCNGLTDTDMAEALIEKGAKVFIGWLGPVTASHTDATTARLLQHFIIEKRTLKESVQETFKELGPDPTYKSLLVYYPLEAGQQTMENAAPKQPATSP